MKIEVRFQVPYPAAGLTEEWRSDFFNTLPEAERRVKYYRECGSPAHIAPSSLAQFAHLK